MTNAPPADLREVVADIPGERLDVAVARLCDLSRAQAQRLIGEGNVTAGGRARTKAGERLTGGETLCVLIPPAVPSELQAEDVALTIVYEDDSLIVVDKPAGMAVHPGPGHDGETLVNALLGYCPDLRGIGGVQRPGIVHRLDKDTSGLIIVAKDERSHNALADQMQARQVKKTYLALVEGRVEPPEALIDAPIGRDPNNRQRMMIRPGGSATSREAQTTYRVRTRYASSSGTNALGGGYTLVEASLITGRTHQIRVHFASLGHAVVGDSVYGRRSPLVERQFLHAWRLTFHHPLDGRELSFESPLPPDLQAALSQLG